MIQRKQTLFLLELVFLGIALLFVPVNTIETMGSTSGLNLMPGVKTADVNIFYFIAMVLNVAGLLLSFTTIFLYRKRSLQQTCCYLLLFIWTILAGILSFVKFATAGAGNETIHLNYFAPVICVFAMLAAYLAARFIKKDIELLKSAERIR